MSVGGIGTRGYKWRKWHKDIGKIKNAAEK